MSTGTIVSTQSNLSPKPQQEVNRSALLEEPSKFVLDSWKYIICTRTQEEYDAIVTADPERFAKEIVPLMRTRNKHHSRPWMLKTMSNTFGFSGDTAIARRERMVEKLQQKLQAKQSQQAERSA